MKNERIRIVRVPPNRPPVVDEIEIIDDICYYPIANDNIEISRSSIELKFIELETGIVGICFKEDIIRNNDEANTYGYMTTSYYEPLERNRDIQGHKIYGDMIILGTSKKSEGNQEIERYKSLTLEQVDQYIEMFRLDSRPHIRFNN